MRGEAVKHFNPYTPVPARIVDVIDETPSIKTFVVEPDEPFRFRAGQFAQITVPGLGEAPFTPSSDPARADRLEFSVLRTGRLTDAMHRLKPEDLLGLRGPFGKGYPIEHFEDKEVLIIGGGVGLAPLRSLIYALLGQIDRVRRVSIKYGARNSRELLYRRMYDEWAAHPKVDFTCTIDVPEPGWTGRTGVVTVLLKDLDIDVQNAVAVSCGPDVMLKFVTQELLGIGFAPEQIYLSMNRRMSCGMGKCGRCNIGPYYLCRDGPDVQYALVKDFANVF